MSKGKLVRIREVPEGARQVGDPKLIHTDYNVRSGRGRYSSVFRLNLEAQRPEGADAYMAGIDGEEGLLPSEQIRPLGVRPVVFYKLLRQSEKGSR